MDPDGNILYSILLLLLLTVVYGFFIMCEIGMVALNDKQLKKMAQDGDKNADIISRLFKSPTRFAAAIRIGSALCGFFMAVIIAGVPLKMCVGAFAGVMPFNLARIVSVILVTVLFLLLTIVFGEIVPRKIALLQYNKIAFFAALPLWFFFLVFRPLAAFFAVVSGFFLRLFGINPETEPSEATEEEIRMLLDAGEERGSIEESETEMIRNIFELNDSPVVDVMTHRTEIVFLEKGAPLVEIIDTALKSGHSRIPVCDENGLDSITGILYVKDLLELVKDDESVDGFSIENHMREPLYVLESNSCMAVLSIFKTKKIHMAIIADEYGGTSGLVTMEDLLEFIVGNIQDEYDEEEDEEILALSDGRFIIDGLTSLEDVDKYLGLELSVNAELETIGGYVIDLFGRLPDEGEHPSVEAGGYRFTVSEMDGRRVKSLEAEKIDDLAEELSEK